MESIKLKIYQNRLFVADLIMDVICDRKTVNEATALFPKEPDDINLKCAFDALVHREADEDLRLKVKDYAQMQDEFLADLAYLLKENEQFPQNIIDEYKKYHNDNLIGDWQKPLKSVLKNFKRMINF